MKKKDPIETLRNPAPGVTLTSFEFKKRCEVCALNTHAKYHDFTRAPLNPVALIQFVERHSWTAPLVCAAIVGYVYAVTGMDVEAMREELAREAAQERQARLVDGSAEILSSERSTPDRPRERVQELLRSAKSSDGRAAALDAAPSPQLPAEEAIAAWVAEPKSWRGDYEPQEPLRCKRAPVCRCFVSDTRLHGYCSDCAAAIFSLTWAAALARSAPAETVEGEKNDEELSR